LILPKPTDRVFIAEGLETALSIKETGVSGRIVAGLGINNLANYTGPEKTVVLIADNDEHKPNSQTSKLIEKTAEHFKTSDALNTNGSMDAPIVQIIKPTTPGQDFNDVLKEQGVKGVTEYVKPYLSQASLIEIAKSDSLIQKAADYFDDLFKQIRSEIDLTKKNELINKLDEKMKLFEKDPSIITDIKVINQPVGAKLEELHTKLQELERSKQRNRGMEMK
jgi:hypothetical protein